MYFHGKLSAFKINNYKINNYKINNYKIGRYKINGGFSTTYDYTIPTTVVASAYDTSAAARPQRLSNGWWVTGVLSSDAYYIYLYVSKNNGSTWSQCAYIWGSNLSKIGFSLTSKDTIVCIFYPHNEDTSCFVDFVSFDATITQIQDLNIYRKDLDAFQTAIDTTSLAIDTNGHLTAAWASKNASYPNSFNIRSAK